MSETENFIDEEELAEETSVEHEAIVEQEEPSFEVVGTPEQSTDEILDTILEQKGGNPSDWHAEYQGGGLLFNPDTKEIMHPDGTQWHHPDARFHQALVEQWSRGEGTVQMLPDYTMHLPDKDILFVTLLMHDSKTHEISYSIYSHEMTHSIAINDNQPQPSSDTHESFTFPIVEDETTPILRDTELTATLARLLHSELHTQEQEVHTGEQRPMLPEGSLQHDWREAEEIFSRKFPTPRGAWGVASNINVPTNTSPPPANTNTRNGITLKRAA